MQRARKAAVKVDNGKSKGIKCNRKGVLGCGEGCWEMEEPN